MHVTQLDVPEDTKTLLIKVLKGKVPHLMVFASPNGKMATASAKAWLCDWLGIEKTEHPDLLEMTCTGKVSLHSIDSVRNLIEQLSLAPYSLNRRGVYIDAAERMLPSAANSLLKILEEPPRNTVIILATSAPHLMLPTILSRAQVVRLPGRPEEPQVPLPLLELLAVDNPSYAQIMRAAEKVADELEEESESFSKQLRGERTSEDLLPQAKQQILDEIEGEVGLWLQRHAHQLFEALYLSLRSKMSPLHLQQALDAIQRASDVKNTLVWFLSKALCNGCYEALLS
jgi:DNA polymerase III delta prime subunit